MTIVESQHSLFKSLEASGLTESEAIAVCLILSALRQAKEKWPRWVDDPLHAAAILAEETGEAVQAAHDMVYSGATDAGFQIELAHSGAMAIRCLSNMNEYKAVERYQAAQAGEAR